jgi:ABC-type polysaccharide/polyol phosphate export permease
MLERRRWLPTLLILIGRDLKVRYERSLLGFLWTLLQPAAMFLIYYFVFAVVIRMQIPDYWAFLLAGLVIWHFFSNSLTSATHCIQNNRSIIRKMPFPQQLFVFSAVGSRAVEWLIEITICLTLFNVFLDVPVLASLPALLVVVVLTIVFTTGLCLPVSAGSVFFPDFAYAMPIVLRLLFFICPVFYARHSVPEKYMVLYTFNPINMYLDQFRKIAFEGRAPDPAAVAWMAVIAVSAFGGGYLVFRMARKYFAEIL